MTEEQIHRIQIRTISMVGHPKHQNQLPQENCTKMRRTLQNYRDPRTIELSPSTPFNLETPQQLPCHLPYALHGKQNSQTQLPPTPA